MLGVLKNSQVLLKLNNYTKSKFVISLIKVFKKLRALKLLTKAACFVKVDRCDFWGSFGAISTAIQLWFQRDIARGFEHMTQTTPSLFIRRLIQNFCLFITFIRNSSDSRLKWRWNCSWLLRERDGGKATKVAPRKLAV